MEKDYDKDDLQIAAFEPLTTDKLVCRDCIHKYDNPQLVTKCNEYETKPPKVIYGGSCDKYTKG